MALAGIRPRAVFDVTIPPLVPTDTAKNKLIYIGQTINKWSGTNFIGSFIKKKVVDNDCSTYMPNRLKVSPGDVGSLVKVLVGEDEFPFSCSMTSYVIPNIDA